MNINHSQIISKYFETSIQNTSQIMINLLKSLIDQRYSRFLQISEEKNITIDQLLNDLYRKSGKFPFYLKDNEIIKLTITTNNQS